jgi:hypothetical protein
LGLSNLNTVERRKIRSGSSPASAGVPAQVSQEVVSSNSSLILNLLSFGWLVARAMGGLLESDCEIGDGASALVA